jgi:outer membrane protein assembly factor BamB
VDRRNPGQPADLKRHLLCVSVADGKIIWQRSAGAVLPDDPYRGNIGEHGYASNTPVTDGKHVYAFFGKSGIWAYDIEGNQLWQKGLGSESSNRRWGSAASPILYRNLLIVNASEESLTLYALDKMTGEEAWKVEADKMELSYSTPVIVKRPDGRDELVIAVPSEVWAFEPETGKLNWYAHTTLGGNISPTPVASGGLLYVFGGFPSTEAAAIRLGGSDDVTDTHIVWTSRDASYVPSPVVHGGHLYWVSDRGRAYCADAQTGKVIYNEKLPARGGSKPFYASAVLADGKLYVVSRTSGTFVLAPKPQFEQVAHNILASDDSDFNASPAISNGRIFLRSNRALYCVALD